MKFSVIIPCHNSGPWIADALRSAAGQSHPPHEIIAIDDNSTDDSRQRIEESGVEVMLLESNCHNAGATRNIGIQAASGDWIAMLDADDQWYPDHLRNAAALLADSRDVALMANHDWMNVQGRRMPIPDGFHCKIEKSTSKLSAETFIDVLAGGLHFGHSTVVYCRDRVLELGGFDTQQVKRHDIDLWLRMIHSHTWSYCAEKAASYRVDTPGSISSNEVDAEYYYLKALLKNHREYPVESMQSMIDTSARRAMGLAFVDGKATEWKNAKGLSWPHLTPKFRMYYRLAGLCPPAFRMAMRVRRRILWGLVALK